MVDRVSRLPMTKRRRDASLRRYDKATFASRERVRYQRELRRRRPE